MPWPTLSSDERSRIALSLGVADGATTPEQQNRLRQRALDVLTEILKRHCCNFNQMKNGAPRYDPNLNPAVDGRTQGEPGGEVRIGPRAFENRYGVGDTVGWLYCTLKHEMVHSAQFGDPNLGKFIDRHTLEVEAYQREIDNQDVCGLNDAEKAAEARNVRKLTVPTDRDPPEPRLRLHVALRSHEFRFRGSVPVTVTLRNVSDDPIRVNARLLVNDATEPVAFRELTFAIRAPDGADAPFAWLMKVDIPRRENVVVLRPGHSVETTIDLAVEYFLNRRGVYRVTSAYQSLTPLAEAVGPIESNTVAFELE